MRCRGKFGRCKYINGCKTFRRNFHSFVFMYASTLPHPLATNFNRVLSFSILNQSNFIVDPQLVWKMTNSQLAAIQWDILANCPVVQCELFIGLLRVTHLTTSLLHGLMGADRGPLGSGKSFPQCLPMGIALWDSLLINYYKYDSMDAMRSKMSETCPCMGFKWGRMSTWRGYIRV